MANEPKIGRVVVSSFSAGFGGVRALLKVPEHFARIDGLIMADSIYCGYTGDPKEHKVDPGLMDGFRRFALEAAVGRKVFLVTHSALRPEGYASTAETADFLIDAVGGKADPVNVDWSEGWTQTRAFSKGHFVVLGFAGTEGNDHMSHLATDPQTVEALPRDTEGEVILRMRTMTRIASIAALPCRFPLEGLGDGLLDPVATQVSDDHSPIGADQQDLRNRLDAVIGR